MFGVFDRRPAGHSHWAPGDGARLRYRDWVLALDELTLTAAGQPVNLTAHEFEIVELLAGRPKRVFTKRQIYEAVWGIGFQLAEEARPM